MCLRLASRLLVLLLVGIGEVAEDRVKKVSGDVQASGHLNKGISMRAIIRPEQVDEYLLTMPANSKMSMATSPSLRRSPMPRTQRSQVADSDGMRWQGTEGIEEDFARRLSATDRHRSISVRSIAVFLLAKRLADVGDAKSVFVDGGGRDQEPFGQRKTDMRVAARIAWHMHLKRSAVGLGTCPRCLVAG